MREQAVMASLPPRIAVLRVRNIKKVADRSEQINMIY